MERLKPSFLLSGRYRLVTRIARGGMGQVWEATDSVLDRPVAVKIMTPVAQDTETLVDRFRDEAKLAARLRSPNIIEVYDYGEDGGLAYLVMELLPGTTVANELADHGPLDPARVLQIMADTASALAIAHETGVVHRDIKPSNILLTETGEAKLGDFGIARAMDSASHTRTGEMFGTPQYLSPEQARGEPASPASDLYCLGVVAYELLTGTRPFDKPTPIATALAHVQEPPPALPASVPEPLASLVMSCLAKDPALRPASARAVGEALRGQIQLNREETLRLAKARTAEVAHSLGKRLLMGVSMAALVVVVCLVMMLM